MTNERLRGQMASAGVSVPTLAAHVEVDPKTVERWIAQDRVPHQRHRWATAALLEAEETYIWPETANDVRTQSASAAEFVQLYPNRAMVPDHLWAALVDSARESIDVLVYAGLFLVDSHPDLAEAFAEKARAGTRIRMLLGDPGSEIVAQRGEEEGIGEDLAARIRLTSRALAPLQKVAGIEIRHHHTVLYNSLYRFDSTLLTNLHVYGAPAPHNPVLHLQRVTGGRLFDHYARSFERVWETATAS